MRKLSPSNGPVLVLASGVILYHFTGTWVDLDDRKRPKTVPKAGELGNAGRMAAGPPALSRWEFTGA